MTLPARVTKEMVVETFLAEFVEEALDVGILPRSAGCQVDRVATLLWQPAPNGMGNELPSIVTTQVLVRTMELKSSLQQMDNILVRTGANNQQRQTLAAELVQDREYTKLRT